MYGVGGTSEMVIGRWLTQVLPGLGGSREDIVIATKGYGPTGAGPNDSGYSRKHILAAVNASLKRLQTDYIDLYQVHGWDGATGLKELMTTMDNLVREGKIRYWGCSNWSAWQLQKSMDMANYIGFAAPCVSIQQQYSLLERNLELDLLDVCKNEGVGILPWSPLKGW